MHDWISEFQLTSSAAAHGKTNQQTQVSSREEFFFFFNFCVKALSLVEAKPSYLSPGR